MKHKRLLGVASAIAIGHCWVGTPAAFAQTAPSTNPGQTAASGAPDASSDDIVVTAQRREERLKDVPMSISAVSGESLERRGLKTVEDLSFAVPGLQARDWGGGRMEIAIRGINSSRGSSSLVGLYLDEAPLSGATGGDASDYINIQALDLKRIEVLKGPQGTLFGEGAVGGVIRYITNDPDLTRFGGQASATFYGTRDGDVSEEGSLVLNVPLSGNLGVRVAGTYQNRGGWIDNVGTGKSDFNTEKLGAIRGKVLWEPLPALSIRGLVEISRDRGGGSNQVFAPYDQSIYYTPIDTNLPTKYSNDHDIYNLTGEYDLGFATLLSSTTHLRRSGDGPYVQHYVGSPPPGSLYGAFEVTIPDNRVRSFTTSQELRLTSKGASPFHWTIGGLYKDDHFTYGFPQGFDAVLLYGVILPPGLSKGFYTRVHSKSWAVFGDISYTLFDKLTIGGGVRYYRDDRTISGVADVTSPVVVDNGTFSKPTYRGYVRYEVSPHVNIYANVATGFRSGGFNTAAAVADGAPHSYGPEDSIFYEAGLKSTLLNGLVDVNLAAYTGLYKDQLQDAFFQGPSGPQEYTLNGGRARIRGFEWDLAIHPVRALRLSFSGELLDTKFTRVTPLAPVAVGDHLSGAPGYDFQVSADYNFKWAANAPGNFQINYSERGRVYSYNRGNGGYLPDVDASSPLHFMDASLGAMIDGYEVRVFGRNLLDERSPLNTGGNTIGTYIQARPRNIGVSVSKSF